ncbi:hypothetical protein [Micromonospora sp. NBC_01813]|uniref:hypothetical protein n=1 Tax=Micromonospora sp. NBC_01813 TaxID=2975988 RepID=UPI002DDB6EB7|nr:hypothetical protein [Micromonospora sp. NBC_01813]WSA06794.1 hypothetical protein OG958_21235 [Micromonospora sp. NBC_01813]
MKRRQSPHTDWCARDHRCNLAEHRAPSLTIHLDGGGVAVLTRVKSASGREHADVTLSVPLADSNLAARRQLAGLLADTRTMVGRVAALARPRPRG